MSQESDVCCTTSMYDIQNRCIPDEIDLFYFKTCIITHNNNVIEQNINVSMFDILAVKEPHMTVVSHRTIGYFYCALLLSRTSCQTPLLENSFDHCHHNNNLFINCRIILYSGIRLKTTGTFKF